MATTEPTAKDFPVMDCDGHIIEPGVIWSDYVEAEFLPAVRQGFWKEDTPGGWEITVNGQVELKRQGDTAFFGAVLVPGMDKDKLSRVRMGVDQFPIPAGAHEPQARLRDMDLMGIDQAMLLPTFCGMWLTSVQDPRAAHGVCRAYNNWIADFCKEEPTRLFAAGIIPQQDLDDAVAEVKRIAGMGFRCVIIRPNVVAGRYPAHPDFDAVWGAIQDAGLVAGIHPFPAGILRKQPIPSDCSAWFIDRAAEASGLRIGMVSESICFSHDAETFLLLAFHNDLYTKFPRLKLAVLESNASWLPYFLDKADGRVKVWTATRGTEVEAVPSKTFLDRSWIAFESDEETVFEVWRRFADIGVWASDYPHFDAEDAWEAIEHMTEWGVPRDVQAKMLGENACRMYGIEPKLVVTERRAAPEVSIPA